MRCNKCGYEWNTKSKMAYVSCPSCLSKVKNNSKESELYNLTSEPPA